MDMVIDMDMDMDMDMNMDMNIRTIAYTIMVRSIATIESAMATDTNITTSIVKPQI